MGATFVFGGQPHAFRKPLAIATICAMRERS
jgi:hypothetical protein